MAELNIAFVAWLQKPSIVSPYNEAYTSVLRSVLLHGHIKHQPPENEFSGTTKNIFNFFSNIKIRIDVKSTFISY